MVEEIHINSKNSRAFGWIQDSSNIESLCNVVAVFNPESDFHKQLVENIIPTLVSDKDGKEAMLSALNNKPLSLKYRMLIGTSFSPR